MLKLITITIFFLSFFTNSFTQDSTSSYIGFNVPPALGNTIELGFEINPKSTLTFDIYGGFTFNSKLNGICSKVYTGLEINNKSGAFIKLGARYNWRNSLSKFAPFFGVNITNAISMEKGTQDEYFISENDGFTSRKIPFNTKKYNVGLSGVIGVTSPSTNRFSMDLGIQFGGLLLDNLVGCNSYMPGMGSNLGLRLQGVFRIKYRIN